MQLGIPSANIRGLALACDHRLRRRRQRQIEGDHHLWNRGGRPGESFVTRSQDCPGAVFKRSVMKHAAKAEKVPSANGIGGGLGAIIILFHPHTDQRISGSTAEIASTGFVPEQLILSLLKFERPFQPIRVPLRFVEVEEPLDEECVIFGKGRYRTRLTTPAAQKSIL